MNVAGIAPPPIRKKGLGRAPSVLRLSRRGDAEGNRLRDSIPDLWSIGRGRRAFVGEGLPGYEPRRNALDRPTRWLRRARPDHIPDGWRVGAPPRWHQGAP